MNAIWIDTNEKLNACVERWMQLPAVGIDTEFEHRRTFYPREALMQVYDGKDAYLLDPLKITDYKSLASLLISPNIVKVFHSSQQDLLVLRRMCSVVANPIFDVQIAAMLSGDNPQCSYQYLVSKHYEMSLDKSETTSDWMHRPLSTQQVEYAADDVRYLLGLYERYREELQDLNRLEWLRDDCEYLTNMVDRDERLQKWRPPMRLFGSKRYRPRVRAILRELGDWREREARGKDVPRGWIMQDKELLSAARHRPKTINELVDVCGMTRRRARNYGHTVLKIIENSRVLPEDNVGIYAVSPSEEDTLLDAVRERETAMSLNHGALLYRTEVRSLLYAHKNGLDAEGRVSCAWRKEIMSTLLLPR